MSDPNSGEGWYEWVKAPGMTTEIAHVSESGEVYAPGHGWNPAEFLLASAEGRAHRLVRADDEDALAEALSDLMEANPLSADSSKEDGQLGPETLKEIRGQFRECVAGGDHRYTIVPGRYRDYVLCQRCGRERPRPFAGPTTSQEKDA